MKNFLVAAIILFIILVIPTGAQIKHRAPSKNKQAAGPKSNPPNTERNSGNTNTAGATTPPDPALSKEIVGEFVYIPDGEFMMGSNNEEDFASPVHRVKISRSFEMGKYEVTQAEWKAVMGNNPSQFKGADRPVENVSWEEVQKFIEVLNSRSKKYYYRLPTEAEWEYACRAGGAGGDAGNLESMAWFGNNSGSKPMDTDKFMNTDRVKFLDKLVTNGNQTHPVGQKKPNAWGLYDMLGNVWEWCQDWYGNYSNSYQVDPHGPASGTDRVERGGSWNVRAERCRSAFRAIDAPSYGGFDVGFRLVRTPR